MFKLFFYFLSTLFIYLNSAELFSETTIPLHFFSDYKQEEITAPFDCTFIVDNKELFKVYRASNKIMIEATGIREGAGLLILECKSGMKAYSLDYKNARKYGASEQKDLAYLPSNMDSYVGLSSDLLGPEAFSIYDFEFQDKSYPFVGMQYANQWNMKEKNKLISDRIFFTHQITEETQVGYYLNRSLNQDAKNETLGGHLSFYGYSLNALKTIDKNKNLPLQTGLNLSIPSPFQLNYRYKIDHQQKVTSHSIAKSFYYRISKFYFTFFPELVYKISQEKKMAENFDTGIKYDLLSNYSLGLKNKFACQPISHCLVEQFIIENNYRIPHHEFELEYGIKPKSVGLRHEFDIAEKIKFKNYINFTYKLASTDWGFQTVMRDYLFYINNHIPVYPAVKDPGFALTFGMRKYTYQFGFESFYNFFPFQKDHKHLIAANVKKIIHDYNLAKTIKRLKSHSIEGTVTANYNLQKMRGVKIELIEDENVINKTESNDNGYYHFSNVPSSGNLVLKTTYKNFTDQENFTKDINENHLTKDLMINMNCAVEIKFFRDNGNNDFDSKDELISLSNYFSEINEAIIISPENSYRDNFIIFQCNQKTELKVNKPIIPFEYELVKYDPLTYNLKNNEKKELRVLLKKKK